LIHFFKRYLISKMSSAANSIICFLCQEKVHYERSDKNKLVAHLSVEHNAVYGHDFLLSGCIMNFDERLAIVNVVNDRDPNVEYETPDDDEEEIEIEDNEIIVGDEAESDLQMLTPETTLQEMDADVQLVQDQGVSPPRMSEKAPIEFPCPECPMTFNLKIRLNRHIKLHDKKEIAIADVSEMKKLLKKRKISNASAGFTNDPPSKPKQGPKVWTPAEGEEGIPCTECGKRFKNRGAMLRHFEDIHQSGEYPCKGCGKMFSSKNKMSSHYSRHCNPLNPNSYSAKRKTIG